MTVVDELRKSLATHGTHTAIIDGATTLTHDQLFDRVDRLSQSFLDLGLQKGDRVAAWLPNSHHAIEAELACLQSGGIWVTLNAQMAVPEIEAILAHTKPHVFILDQTQHDRLAHAKLSPGLRLILTDNPDTPNTLDYEHLLATHQPTRPNLDIQPDDPARLRYTSGTTGTAKAATLSHRVYLASLNVLQQELHPLSHTDRTLHIAPLTHASGAMVFPTIAAGGANILHRSFDPENTLNTIQSQGITALFAVPTILQRLADSPSFQDANLESLKTLTYGGAPMPQDLLRRLIPKLGHALVQIYGLTEALHPITTLKRTDHTLHNSKLASIGTATNVCDIRVVNDEWREQPHGEVGEFVVRGPNVMTGYWRNEDATAEITQDNWLRTGDLGYRDNEGYYFIVDRKKDVIISGGFNVYTSEVEDVLTHHPQITEAAVFGMPDPTWGEAVHAVIVAPTNLTQEALRQHCKDSLSPYKIPKVFVIQQQPLPKNSAGKIQKSELRNQFVHNMNHGR